MTYVVTNKQMKKAEQRCDEQYASYSRLMNNAGTACANALMKTAPERSTRVAILCGCGNNSGDGFVIAKRLAENGYQNISVILVNGKPKTDCAFEHFGYLSAIGQISIVGGAEYDFCGTDVVVDCIFGTGFHGELPENIAALISASKNVRTKIAVDVPSGVNSDTGEFDERCFMPTHTFVLAAMKKGLLRPECSDILGEISVLDIGIPDVCFEGNFSAVLTDESFRLPLESRKRSSHKGSFGHLLNIAGSFRYNGAAAMSTMAALRMGVGLCTLASTKNVIRMHASAVMPAICLPLEDADDGGISEYAIDDALKSSIRKATAVCIGCGMGNNINTQKITEFVVKNADCPILIDADGINCLARNIDILKERRGQTVLTPHPKEFSRLSGMSVSEIQSDRIEAAKQVSAKLNSIVVLKGANTVIAAPDGRAYVNTTGNAGLARGGSGDVLAGMISALLAQGVEPLTAAISGVYCHGMAADILLCEMPMECMLPTDIIGAIPEVLRR